MMPVQKHMIVDRKFRGFVGPQFSSCWPMSSLMSARELDGGLPMYCRRGRIRLWKFRDQRVGGCISGDYGKGC